MNLFDKHIELIKDVNDAKSKKQHIETELILSGFRKCLDVQGINHYIDCDLYFMKKNRPMCCGVFLDWKPSI